MAQDKLVYLDAQGKPQELRLDLGFYREAADQGFSLKEYLNAKHPTNVEKYGSAYEQALEQCEIFVGGNRNAGIKKSNFFDVLNPGKEASGPITREGVPASRILFPAVILDIVEDKLSVNRGTTPNALATMVAHTDTIQGTRWERPVLNFSKPEGARTSAVGQLSLPNVMLTITVSDKSQNVPTWALGMEISEQALKSTSLDLVGLALGRQAEVERNERANAYILSMLQGDADYGMGALSAIPGKVVTAQSLDAGVTVAGTISQKAWITWLQKNSAKRQITTIVTDLATAMAIEGRSGKPTVQSDNPNSRRIDTLFEVLNPTWPANVQIFLTEDANWPANTIMGFDNRYAIHNVKSLSAQYSAVEQFALKRSTALRFDNGEAYYRLFDEAFEVLTLTVA